MWRTRPLLQCLQQPAYCRMEIKNSEKTGGCHLCASTTCLSRPTLSLCSSHLKKNKGPESLKDLLKATELTSSGARIQTGSFCVLQNFPLLQLHKSVFPKTHRVWSSAAFVPKICAWSGRIRRCKKYTLLAPWVAPVENSTSNRVKIPLHVQIT